MGKKAIDAHVNGADELMKDIEKQGKKKYKSFFKKK